MREYFFSAGTFQIGCSDTAEIAKPLANPVLNFAGPSALSIAKYWMASVIAMHSSRVCAPGAKLPEVRQTIENVNDITSRVNVRLRTGGRGLESAPRPKTR